MHLDPIIIPITILALTVLAIGMALRRFRQPYLVAYLIAGILVGPQVLGVVEQQAFLSRLGTLGVDLLLFYVGLEISLPQLKANWRVTLFGTLFQIIASTLCVGVLGFFLNWPFDRVILLGFVISLSSTAVVLKMLQDWDELKTKIGSDALSILLAQDLAIVPMLIAISFLGAGEFDRNQFVLQIVGGIFFITLLFLLNRRKSLFPTLVEIQLDHESQIFAALGLCFGLALVSALFGLSSALGAFMAGIVVGTLRGTRWAREALQSFQVVFLGIFFISIGMLVDLKFLATHLGVLVLLTILVFVTNTFINMAILRSNGNSVRESLYGGALLAQIGELSFVLAAVGLQASIITDYAYQTTVLIIALTLLLSPAWIILAKRISKVNLKQ